MAVIQPPGFLPVLAATAGLFRHARPGLADPSLLPVIERVQADASLDPRWLAAYCACVGLPDSAHLPPLALQIAAAPLHMAILGDARFPFRALGMVHLTQRIVQTRPLPTGARLDLRAFCSDARWEKRGMSFGLVTEARCDGELAWHAETRALAPGKTPATATVAVPLAGAEPGSAADGEQVVQVAEATGRRYAAIAGDLNPIHQHALLARLFGFRRAIVHGTWTLARALAVADLPATSRFTLDARFRRPVELPSEIVVRTWRGRSVDAGEGGAVCHRIRVSPRGGERTCVEIDLMEPATPN